MDVLCPHNVSLFNTLRFPLFFMEDHLIFWESFLELCIFFKNLNQPANPRNYIPTNVPIFMNPRKLGPTKINDFTVIKRTIGLVLGPSTFLCRSSLKHYTLTNKAEGTIWRDLSKPHQGDKALVLVPSYCKSELLQSLDLSSLRDGQSMADSGGCLYIFLIYYVITLVVCVMSSMVALLWLVVGPRSS